MCGNFKYLDIVSQDFPKQLKWNRKNSIPKCSRFWVITSVSGLFVFITIIECLEFISEVVKNEDQMWFFKSEHQITFPFIEITSKDDEKWITMVIAHYSFPIFFHSISINKKDIRCSFFKFDIWSSFLITYGLNPMHLISLHFNANKQALKDCHLTIWGWCWRISMVQLQRIIW